MTEQTKIEQKKAQPLVGEILEYTRLDKADAGYDLAHQGVEALLGELLSRETQLPRIDKALVEQMITELDNRLSQQMNSILHAPEFQAIESTWRGLDFLVQRTEFNE
ncbi:MAG: type VI secretion system contractile sheath large subunit, partial [Pseudomonadaceae bacterium]|nr:type VI secretion system contractile sheath large subunit [Pseudomonadaceae bacterium]